MLTHPNFCSFVSFGSYKMNYLLQFTNYDSVAVHDRPLGNGLLKEYKEAA